jgi:hypothetical protein
MTLYNPGYAEQDVPVRVGNLCEDCRNGAVPEDEF